MDDATRYSILTAVVILLVAGCVIGAFSCLDFLAEQKGCDDNRTQVSTLTQSDDGRTPRKRKVRIEGDDSSEASSLLDDGTQIKTDKALMDTFVKVLTNGITLKMHSLKDKAPKEVKLMLDKSMLTWKSVHSRNIMGAFKPKNMDLKNVKSIEWGKNTETFKKELSASTPVDVCFSLVGEDGVTLDFEVSSPVERDSLAQGFTILINFINQDDVGV